ncbi:hypothetical protein L484_019165 [Morus notabilis]|uniref:Senescence regulator S40 n=1 Tax=Morus notabilis TaxID=981085 RepID=W9R4X7_9ROSA|nr:uncharacterized protein LOC21402116 [Morus notabilis]EXB54595.1 hypothetical protein L484_019165 [Morus notabilis]
MESATYRHSRSPSSDRFLGIFTFSPPSSSAGGSTSGSGGELIEAEVFWTNDFSEPSQDHGDSALAGVFPGQNRHRSSFAKPQKSGILAVLPESDRGYQVLCRKASISPSSSVTMSIPVIPRPPITGQSSQEREYLQSVPAGKLQHQSAPMNVPLLAKAMAKRRNFEVFEDDAEEEDDKVLPPHEIVARGSGVSPKTTFSVLEGVGRTLKGRDLRQVRNAIWRKTGFLD